ncbi:MAG TPA: sialidase family protein [Gemmatimonadaceae bacterium]|nr:sialidase family protein [Gemmatimonadaceae bacterium]
MRPAAALPALLALAACEPAPIVWQDAARLEPAAVAAAGPAWRLTVDASGARPAPRPAAPHAPPAAGACPGSVVTAHERGADWHAAWWAARADSSVVLLVARSADDGRTWTAPLAADDADRGRRACARPAPAIAADSATGYVYVAYWAEPAGGGGEFLVHSMDRGVMWHPPMALGYGADPASADVAAEGDTVAVAYESPNANDGWIDVAISATAGHITDMTAVAVSGRSTRARAPRAALGAHRVAVAWLEDDGRLAMARLGERRR